MTGKELMLYILQNNLEDAQVFENGTFLDFMTIGKAAVKYNVGIATVKNWVELGKLPSITIGTVIYIPKNAEDPRKAKMVNV